MKNFIKLVGKKSVFVAVGALLVGCAVTAGTFAAVPNSTTGVISACYTNSSGALRVIDAEAGGTCTASETLLTWSSATTDKNSALLRLEPDTNDPAAFVMNNTRSRNIIDAKTVVQNGTYYLCVKVAFRPEVKVVNVDNTGAVGGGGAPVDLTIPPAGSDFAAGVESLCGSGYNVIAFLSGTNVTAQSVLFSN